MSVIKPALKNEYKKPDVATQVIIDTKNLLRDRLRMGGYKISPGLKAVLVAAFTSKPFPFKLRSQNVTVLLFLRARIWRHNLLHN